MISDDKMVEELRKCYADRSGIYMIDNHISICDSGENKTAKLKLSEKQKEFIKRIKR